ncbi:hypothetical protein ON010_g17891 [Phytophthora cinnamomi]|nr:hypothetical protein ON010_g17891 [Phytophthora cinnamomi]
MQLRWRQQRGQQLTDWLTLQLRPHQKQTLVLHALGSSDLHSVDHPILAVEVPPPDRDVSPEPHQISPLANVIRCSSDAEGSSRSKHDGNADWAKNACVKERQRSVIRSNTAIQLSPRSEIPAVLQPNSDQYMECHAGRVYGRTRARQQSTFAECLWKRNNTSVNLKHSTRRSEARRSLQTRNSIPAGVSVVAVASVLSEIPPIIDEHNAPLENDGNGAQTPSLA